MTVVQVPVWALRHGMYVSALDRPWTDTPFPFQGFIINDNDVIMRLRSYCKYVLVDRERSIVPIAVQNDRIAIPDSGSVADPNRSLDRGVRQQAAASTYLNSLFDDIRLGRSVDAEEAKEQVSVLVNLVAEDAAAAMWLTQLRNRDEYTSLHCLNVCVMSIAFCRQLGYCDEDLRVIGLGALLHDVGKASTPLHILNKPGPLTREEFAVIQRHPEDGYRMMRKAGGLSDEALDIIRYHHERVSGRGYPTGRGVNELSQAILAVAIADVYDALTSDRAYHKGLPSDAALQIMYRDAGSTYGQELMEAFIRCVGIYPVGCLVELVSGAIALVIDVDQDNRLLPEVLILRDGEGRETVPPPRVRLSAKAGDAQDSPWLVRRMVTGRELEMDQCFPSRSSPFRIPPAPADPWRRSMPLRCR